MNKGKKQKPMTKRTKAAAPVEPLVMPDSSATDNLLIDTIVRIRIATKLITPMLTELPGEVRRLFKQLQDDRKRLCEMVGAAYTAGWMDGYESYGSVADIEGDKDFCCGEDWLERDLRRELLEIMDRA